jgi:hypothetical protein
MDATAFRCSSHQSDPGAAHRRGSQPGHEAPATSNRTGVSETAPDRRHGAGNLQRTRHPILGAGEEPLDTRAVSGRTTNRGACEELLA